MNLYEYVRAEDRCELLLEWDRGKNRGLDPSALAPCSHQKIWWVCEKGHQWQSTLFSRVDQKRGCPYCAGQKPVPGETDLAALRPEVAARWDQEQNGSLTPREATVWEYFVRGTEPKTVTEYWQVPDPPTDLTVTLSDDVAEISFTPPSRYMTYRLYREDEDGFAILLATVENAAYPVRYSDPVNQLNGSFNYYVVPVHPALSAGGEPLCGRASGKRRIYVQHTGPFSP